MHRNKAVLAFLVVSGDPWQLSYLPPRYFRFTRCDDCMKSLLTTIKSACNAFSCKPRPVLIRYGLALLVVLLVLGGWWFTGRDERSEGGKPGGMMGRDGRPASVTTAPVEQGDLDVIQPALGTVTALNTATIKPRVDGLLQRIVFQEGQVVKADQVLAELDPRPFQIAVDQAKGQLVRDQAQLTNARLDLERYRSLLDKDGVSRQQVDTQAALVQQYEGVVKLDQAQVDNALLQLDFARIKAPMAGRLGIRQVDVGNVIKSSDVNGLVVLTQTQPIAVLFSVNADALPNVLERWLAGQKSQTSLKVEAWSRDNKTKLAEGKLLTIDNQLDTTTGTVRLKALFDNANNTLFPNQFVNARLRVETLKNVTLVPEAAIQRGTQGAFVYVLNPAEGEAPPTVAMRKVQLGASKEGLVVAESGLKAGESVVIDGLDKLRDGSKVIVAQPAGERRKKN